MEDCEGIKVKIKADKGDNDKMIKRKWKRMGGNGRGSEVKIVTNDNNYGWGGGMEK